MQFKIFNRLGQSCIKMDGRDCFSFRRKAVSIPARKPWSAVSRQFEHKTSRSRSKNMLPPYLGSGIPQTSSLRTLMEVHFLGPLGHFLCDQRDTLPCPVLPTGLWRFSPCSAPHADAPFPAEHREHQGARNSHERAQATGQKPQRGVRLRGPKAPEYVHSLVCTALGQ